MPFGRKKIGLEPNSSSPTQRTDLETPASPPRLAPRSEVSPRPHLVLLCTARSPITASPALCSFVSRAAADDAEKTKMINFEKKKREKCLYCCPRATRGSAASIFVHSEWTYLVLYQDLWSPALGPEMLRKLQHVDQLSEIGASRFHYSNRSCRRKFLRAICFALICSNAKMLGCSRPQLCVSSSAE